MYYIVLQRITLSNNFTGFFEPTGQKLHFDHFATPRHGNSSKRYIQC